MRRGSNGSAPFIVVGLTNTADRCWLDGYARISAYTPTHKSAISLAVHHGTYEVADPGPRRVLIKAGRMATFAVGTSTAYGDRLVLITRLAIGLPGISSGMLTVHIPGGLGATAPTGKPVPMGITAFELR